jgi:predicted Rossmann-fold nucleotide-binding protein
LTWRQIGLHRKPILILNTDGYWEPLRAMLDQIVAEGFADPSLQDMLIWAPDVATLERELATALG